MHIIILDEFRYTADNSFMSRLSFKTFCIELYADHKFVPSNEIYTLFENNGILQMLDNDYDVLHGHGFEYVINDIDTIMERGGYDAVSWRD